MSFDDNEPEVEPPAPSLVGKTIRGKFRVLKQIGEGGMGAVYEAENTWTQRKVAIKVLHSYDHSRQQNARRFMQEARAAANIRHPNIVDVLDIDTDTDGTLFLVQELLEGETLRTRLRREKQLEVRAAMDVVVPVMGALIAAHQRGIIHRDIKPDNIFLAQIAGGVTAKLIDFGVAKVPRREGNTLTDSGHLVGTPVYMSPEQASGDREIDARSDLWAIATVLYELLTGTPPLVAPSAPRVLVRVLTEKPDPLGMHCPTLPQDFCAAVDRALTPLDTRWASVKDFLEALLQSSLFATDRDAFRAKHQTAIDSGLYAPVDQPRMTEPELPPSLSPISANHDNPTAQEYPRGRSTPARDKQVPTPTTLDQISQERPADSSRNSGAISVGGARVSSPPIKYIFAAVVAVIVVGITAFSLGKYSPASTTETSRPDSGIPAILPPWPQFAQDASPGIEPANETLTGTSRDSAVEPDATELAEDASAPVPTGTRGPRPTRVGRTTGHDASAPENPGAANTTGFFTNYPH